MDDTKKLTDLLRLNSTEKDKLLRLARDRKVDPVDLNSSADRCHQIR